MKYCSQCGQALRDDAIFCSNCGYAAATTGMPQHVSDDHVSVGLCVLSVLIPLVGFIYWGIERKKRPNRAKACGIAGLVSWLVCFLLLL